MRKVAVRTLKAQTSELLRAVQDGETVVVTRRGRPIARLDSVELEVRRPVRLRGMYTDLSPALEGLDLVEEIRQLRRESAAHLDTEGPDDAATTEC